MADSVAMTDKLNFGDVRRRAVSARSIKMKLPAINGAGSFSPGQSIIVQLPGNQENTFYDLSKTYLQFTITNSAGGAGNANDAYLDGLSGAYCLFDRLTVSQAGTVINDVTGYNVLMSALMATHSSKDYNMNVASTLIGCGSAGAAKVGALVEEASANPVTVALPIAGSGIAHLTPQRYLPAFSRGGIQLQYYLDSMVNSVVSAGTPVLAITNVELVTTAVQLSPEAGRLVDELVGGNYTMLQSDYRGTTATITGTGAATSHVSTLGFSFSSLDRVYWVARSSDSQTQANNSIGARSNATASEFSMTVGSQTFPDRPVVVGGAIDNVTYGTGALAELLVAQGSLTNYSVPTQLNTQANYAYQSKYAVSNSAGSTEAKTGAFVAAVECESMEGASGLFSGTNTVGSITQFKHEFSALPAKTFTLNYYANFTSQLSLNMRALGVFQVSV